MSETLLKVGMIGAGSISNAHLKAAKEGAGVEVVAVCDIIEERAKIRSEEYDIPEVYTDHETLLKKADVDAVIIGVPNAVHHVIAINALKAGKHVLCEKPMAINVAAAEQMVAAAQDADKVLQVGLVHRMRPEAQYLRNLVVSGELGNVYYAKAMMIRRKGIPGWGSWFTTKEESGGGPLIDIGVHALDLAWFMIGNPKPVSVTGVTATAFGPYKRGVGKWGIPNWEGKYDVEDFAGGFVRFENGAVINLEVSWALHMPPETRINVCGEKKGALTAFNSTLQLYSEVDGELVDEPMEFEKTSMFNTQLKRFVAAVKGEEPVITPGEHGLIVNRMLEAIYESAAAGEEVRLD